MSVALLIIGFSYIKTKDEHTLPVLSDMRKVYNHYKNFKNMHKMVITDIETVNYLKNIESNDLLFFNNICYMGQYYLYKDLNGFLEQIKTFLKNKTRIIIYYSGHGYKNEMILPKISLEISFIYEEDLRVRDRKSLLFESFKEYILNYTVPDSQILVIMDCCSGNGINLPFKLSKNGIYHINNTNIPKQNIVCISSSSSDQSSIYNIEKGSIFTIELLKSLRLKYKYHDLVQSIGIKKLNHFYQSVNVYASFPNLKYIWNWVIYPSDDVIYIKDKMIIIEKQK